jgi:hypothetical protein
MVFLVPGATILPALEGAAMPSFRAPRSRDLATLTILLVVFAFLCGGRRACGQTPATGAPNEAPFQLKATSNLVVVRVVVRDAQGKPVENLKKEDFKLFDRGKEQSIEQFEVETLTARLPVQLQFQGKNPQWLPLLCLEHLLRSISTI